MWFQQTNGGGSVDHSKLSGNHQELTSAMAGHPQNGSTDNWPFNGQMSGMMGNNSEVQAHPNVQQGGMYGDSSQSDGSALLAFREANRRQALIDSMDAQTRYGAPAPSQFSAVSNSTNFPNHSNFNSMSAATFASPTAMQILMQQQFGSNPFLFAQDQQVVPQQQLNQQCSHHQVHHHAAADNTQPLCGMPEYGSLGPKLESNNVSRNNNNKPCFDDSFDAGGIPLNGLNPESLVKRSFPEKIYSMLEAVEAQGQDDVISYVADGAAFMIHNPTIFETDIMPLYFSSRRMASFQRQLNIYGFKRVEKGSFRGAYSHEFFAKGKKQMLEKIKRSNKKA